LFTHNMTHECKIISKERKATTLNQILDSLKNNHDIIGSGTKDFHDPNQSAVSDKRSR
jgi:hypothetical protein